MCEPWQQQLSHLPTAVAVALQQARASCDGLHHGDQRRRSSRSISCATAALRFIEQLASGSIETPAARTRSAEQPAAPAATIRRASRGWCAPTTRLRLAPMHCSQPRRPAVSSCSVVRHSSPRVLLRTLESSSFAHAIELATRDRCRWPRRRARDAVCACGHVAGAYCVSFHMHCTAVPQPCSVCESYFALPCLCLLELCYCHLASGWRP